MSEDLEKTTESVADAVVDDAARHGETDEGEDDFEGHRHSPGSTTDSVTDSIVDSKSDA